jgi:hypothetical protein
MAGEAVPPGVATPSWEAATVGRWRDLAKEWRLITPYVFFGTFAVTWHYADTTCRLRAKDGARAKENAFLHEVSSGTLT